MNWRKVYLELKMMTKKDFNDVLITDFEFQYNGKNYFICPIGNGYSCGEYGTDDPVEYTNIDEVWNNFILDGKVIKDVADQIDW